MDHARVRRLLATLGRELGDRVILWRGAELTGSDVDLLVLRGARAALESVLAREGLTARADGHWADPSGDLLVDPLDESDWPAAYPSVAGVAERATAAAETPPVAAPEDRVLIFAAEAVAGRPLAKLLPKLRSLAGGRGGGGSAGLPGAGDAGLAGGTAGLAGGRDAERTLAVGRQERALSLARIGLDPDRIAGASVRGALSYRLALAAGLGSRRGRAALRTRLAATVARRLRPLATAARRVAQKKR